jgi:hypothetical protein
MLLLLPLLFQPKEGETYYSRSEQSFKDVLSDAILSSKIYINRMNTTESSVWVTMFDVYCA